MINGLTEIGLFIAGGVLMLFGGIALVIAYCDFVKKSSIRYCKPSPFGYAFPGVSIIVLGAFMLILPFLVKIFEISRQTEIVLSAHRWGYHNKDKSKSSNEDKCPDTSSKSKSEAQHCGSNYLIVQDGKK